jgi:thiol-disulfide isomerase/thioredoxin
MSEIKVLKFWAPWCKPCTAMSVQLEGLDIESHNIDDKESNDLISKFRIRNIPMLIFLKGDEEVHRHAGLISKPVYLETLSRLNEAGKISLEESLSLTITDNLIKD